MKIEPAHVDQVRRGSQGRMITISADVGGVVEDLKRIDPHLGVRFAEDGDPPYWHVYWSDGRSTYLVLSAQAFLNRSGTWVGLDQRIVKRVKEIDAHSGYDYAAEVQKQNEQANRDAKRKRMEELGDLGEQAAHAVRKDLRSTKRIVVPRDL